MEGRRAVVEAAAAVLPSPAEEAGEVVEGEACCATMLSGRRGPEGEVVVFRIDARWV